MRILVTGGAGYLGGVLVPELVRRGHRVRVLDALMFGKEGLAAVERASELEVVYGDVRHADCVARVMGGMEAVIHLAALVGEPACTGDPALAEVINFSATRVVLGAAREAGVERFVFASTCSNYGLQEHDADESTELRPLSVYAETKVRAEREVLQAASSGFSPCVVRLATLHGVSPRMRFNLLVNLLTREAVLKRSASLYGSDAWRPYVHVTDAARAFVTLVESPPERLAGEVYNVGADNARKIDVVEHLRGHVPDLRVKMLTEDPDRRNYRVSYDKFSRAFGFTPEKLLPQSIAEMCRALEEGRFGDPWDPKYDLWVDASRLGRALEQAVRSSGT
jgi:nucleoside-diphosphate-sugar epimerase